MTASLKQLVMSQENNPVIKPWNILPRSHQEIQIAVCPKIKEPSKKSREKKKKKNSRKEEYLKYLLQSKKDLDCILISLSTLVKQTNNKKSLNK